MKGLEFCKVISISTSTIQRVPALCGFWDLKKTALQEIHFSGTVGGSEIRGSENHCIDKKFQKLKRNNNLMK